MALADRRILLAPVHYQAGADVGGSEFGWAYNYVEAAAKLFGHVDAVVGELRNGAFPPNVSVHQVLPVDQQHLFSTPTVLRFLRRYSSEGWTVARRSPPDILHHLFPWSPYTFNPLILSRRWPFGIDGRTRVVMGPLTPSHAIDFEEDYPTSIARRKFGGDADETRANNPPPPGSLPRRIAGSLCRATLRRADAIFTLRADMRDWIAAIGVRTSVEVIPPGISFERFPFVDRSGRNGPFKFVQASMLIKRKAIDLTLRAMANAVARGADVTYSVIGDGPQREPLTQLTAELGLTGRVEFVGFRDQRDLTQRYADADALITMSWAEGLPPGVMEAMATGLPCISAANDGARALLRDEETGLLVTIGDANACARAIERLASDRLYALRLGAAAHADARRRFHWDVVGAALARLYESVL